MRLPRLTEASLYWICLAVLATALIDLRWVHWVSFADRQLSDSLLKIIAIPRNSASQQCRFLPSTALGGHIRLAIRVCVAPGR